MRGIVFSGSGSCSSWWNAELCGQLRGPLGYVPVPGSMNVVLFTQPKLGGPACTFWDKRRPPRGRNGGVYYFWPARFGTGAHAINGHVMVPDIRGHGKSCVELVAPVRLRDAWQIKDGDRVWIKLQ